MSFQLGMTQVDPPAFAAPYRGQGAKSSDCVVPTRIQSIPKPSQPLHPPWTIEVRNVVK